MEDNKDQQAQPQPEPPKQPVKKDWVPEESFSWDLNLVAIATKEERAKKKEGSFTPAVIKTDASSKSSEPGMN